MGGNPLVLALLVLGVLLLVALGALAFLQRKMFTEQRDQVMELLEEFRELAETEGLADEQEEEEDDA